MVVSEGKLYLVSGNKVKRLDALTLAVEASADIPVPGQPIEELRSLWIRRYDRNRDGAVTADEFPTPAMIGRLDRNGDGRVTAEETPAELVQSRIPPGPVSLAVGPEGVYVSRAGWVYRFAAADLGLAAQADLSAP
jgi:hypothetical protein